MFGNDLRPPGRGRSDKISLHEHPTAQAPR
ncbi:hypothetical protein EDF71_10720 [Comamonas sp. JUb58]|nr:hypothetical protein EDF71_10720 [Comamonas sp. JUb58]